MSRRLFRGLRQPAARPARRPTRFKSLHFELLEQRATPAGLVAAYSFNEGAGSTVIDLSGNLNSGTITNATWSTTGKYGNALSFNGTNALVTVADSNSLDLTTGMTLEAWVNPNSVPAQWQDVIYKGSNDNYYMMATSTAGGVPATGGTYAGNDLLGVSALAVNSWSHLAATYDGATIRLYVNGVQVASRAETDPIAASNGALMIGGDTVFGQYFAGQIDEVRIYNRELNASEIQTDMNTPVTDTAPPIVTLTYPAAGATVSGTVATTATASDNVGVVGVQLWVDGVPYSYEDQSLPYGMYWDSTTSSNGQHTLRYRARDAAGNFTDSASITVTVNNDPAQVGQWSGVMDWPLVTLNMVEMKNGKVLVWDGGWNLCIGSESVRVWDPATNTFTPVPIPDPEGVTDIFCSGQTVLDDGRVLIVGGHECNLPQWFGQANAYIFDPDTYQWTILPVMQYRRWYPTATTLPDGRAIVIGGSDRDWTEGSYSHFPEIFDPKTNTWTTITNGSQVIPNYPFVFVLPDGNVLVAGSDEHVMATYVLNVATQTWSVVDPTVLSANSGVMYAPGKIMKAGASYIAGNLGDYAGIPSAPNTYVLDMTQGQPAWQQTASMAFARSHMNLTILPDGTVAATGGSSDISGVTNENAVLPAEIWSPVTKTWTTMAGMHLPRMYHSTAMLMPDGRILSAGGGRDSPWPTDFLNAEYYSPPYLFKGARPTITSAPTAVSYGSSFFVQTPNAASIASVTLIRNGAVTHSVNMDQRYVPLSFTQGTGGLNVQAPADANLAPPGFYMLFIVNSNGVPSIAPFVQVSSPTALPGDYNENQRVDAADYVLWRKQLGKSATLPNDTTPGSVTSTDYTVWKSNFGATGAQGQSSALTEDYNTDQGVATEDYVASRNQLGSTETLPNDTTPGSVTAADYDALIANVGAAGVQGQQAAGSASNVESQSASDVAIDSEVVVPAAATSIHVDSVTTTQSSTNESTLTASAATDVNLPIRRQRHPVRSFTSLDFVLSQLTKDSLLTARLSYSDDSVHSKSTFCRAEFDSNQEEESSPNVSLAKAFDNIFAELG